MKPIAQNIGKTVHLTVAMHNPCAFTERRIKK